MTDECAVKRQNVTLTDAVYQARSSYKLLKMANSRSDDAAQDYVAAAALLLREARCDRASFDLLCKAHKIRIGTKRVETLAIRLGAADPGLRRSDWANAAAEVVDKLGDALTHETAKQMIQDTQGGIRGLSDLRAGRIEAAEAAKIIEPVSLAEWSEAELFGIPADFEIVPTSPRQEEHTRRDRHEPETYVLALAKIGPTGLTGNVWVYEESTDAIVRRLVSKIKRRKITETGPATYIERCARNLRAATQKDLDGELLTDAGPVLPVDTARAANSAPPIVPSAPRIVADEVPPASDEEVLIPTVIPPIGQDETSASTAAMPSDKEEEVTIGMMPSGCGDGQATTVSGPAEDAARRPVTAGLVKQHQQNGRRPVWTPSPRAKNRVIKQSVMCSLPCGCQHARLCRQEARCLGLAERPRCAA
jgi:hypothetical protein